MEIKNKKKRLDIDKLINEFELTERAVISKDLAEREPELLRSFAIISNLLRTVTYTKFTSNIEQYSNAKKITKTLEAKEKEFVKLWQHHRDYISKMSYLYTLSTPHEWLAYSNDTGNSSKTLCHVLGGDTFRLGFKADIPYDPSDFGRCYRFIKIFPALKCRLREVSKRFIMWKPYVDNWDKLEELWKEEYLRVKCPKLFDYMQELERKSKILDGWIESFPGSGCWTKEVKK